MTGLTAEKHDSFIQIKGSELLTSFKGDALVHGEPDASSFPSGPTSTLVLSSTPSVSSLTSTHHDLGGLRPTHAARGYTSWDPQTPAFIVEEGGVPTLYIPCCFFSWKGLFPFPPLRAVFCEVFLKNKIELVVIR